MTTAIPVILKDTAGNYVLPQSYQIKATAETLGSVRVGSGLTMSNDGVLSTSDEAYTASEIETLWDTTTPNISIKFNFYMTEGRPSGASLDNDYVTVADSPNKIYNVTGGENHTVVVTGYSLSSSDNPLVTISNATTFDSGTTITYGDNIGQTSWAISADESNSKLVFDRSTFAYTATFIINLNENTTIYLNIMR